MRDFWCFLTRVSPLEHLLLVGLAKPLARTGGTHIDDLIVTSDFVYQFAKVFLVMWLTLCILCRRKSSPKVYDTPLPHDNNMYYAASTLCVGLRVHSSFPAGSLTLPN